MVVDRVAIVLPGGAPFGMGRPQGTSVLVLMMLNYHNKILDIIMLKYYGECSLIMLIHVSTVDAQIS